jgi:hypothetical protein
MRVERYTVYRIVPIESNIKVGDNVYPKDCRIDSEYKQKIENVLETVRPSRYPQRYKCLFVCYSKDNVYEWAYIKYGRKNTTYKLLTLEVSGELFWFMSDCYNLLGDKFTQEQLNKACTNYWNSMIENKNDLKLDKGYEGLFVGDAVVKGIEYKNYVNGESRDDV